MDRDDSTDRRDSRDRAARRDWVETTDPGVELADCARRAEDAVRRLAHLTMNGPDLTPAGIELVLAHLAETVATLPQVATQIARILERCSETHELSMDEMGAGTSASLAIRVARSCLEAMRDPAVEAYRRLNTARNQITHIRATPYDDIAKTGWTAGPTADPVRPQRHENRPPPPGGPGRRGPAR